jgi:hypothetical protein
MKIELKFAELQTPLFLEGTNHQTKLPKHTGTTLTWDVDRDKLFVTFKGKTAVVPMPNVASMTPANPAELWTKEEISQIMTKPVSQLQSIVSNPAPTRGRPKAQVSTPMGNLTEPGQGQTGLSTKV